VSSTRAYRLTIRDVTLRRVQKGPDVSKTLPALCREKGYSQTRLERETGIDHSTMQRYWSGNGGLGLKNGRKIADVLDVELSRLGLSEEEAADDDLTILRRAHAALEETVRLLTERVEALERRRGAPRRAATARKRKAGER
jgi:transcriptional regulator with XRE-family HTH domain